MGFYLRKSLKAGPFRFNFSKSGVGVSTGIKGFRIGSGPRGNYVHMGRGGIYYRSSLGQKNRESRSSPSPAPSHPTYQQPAIPDGTVGEMREIESGSILQMSDASSAGLLQELKEKQSRIPFFSLAACAAVVLVLLAGSVSWWLGLPVLVLLAAGCTFLWYYDDTRKSVILFYDFDHEMEAAYQKLHDGFSRLASCKRVWHIGSQGDVLESKYHAGASAVVSRSRITVTAKTPPYVKTNIAIPAIPVGRQTLYLFPDRILVYEGNEVGAVSYEDLCLEIGTTQFVEEEGVPSDARVVGQTWRYTNKSGGPDKRFKDNHQIPVAEYGTIHFKSHTGLNELLQTSRTDAGEPLKEMMLLLAENLSAAERNSENTPASPAEPTPAPQQENSLPKGGDSYPTALLDAMCCMMVADGKIRTSERHMLNELARFSMIDWPQSRIDEYVEAFVEKAKQHGRAKCVEDTENSLRQIKDPTKRMAVAHCINEIAKADGSVDEKERQMRDRLLQVLRD